MPTRAAVLVRQIKWTANVLGSNILGQNAQETASDLAAGKKPFHDVARQVDRHGKTDALIAAARADNCRVDSDQPALRINECTAGVAGIDRRIGLDEILILVETGQPVAAQGTDNPHRHGLAQAVRITNGQHDITNLQLVTVGKRNGGQLLRIDFQDGYIRRRISADDFGSEFPFVFAQGHLDFIGTFDYVIRG